MACAFLLQDGEIVHGVPLPFSKQFINWIIVQKPIVWIKKITWEYLWGTWYSFLVEDNCMKTWMVQSLICNWLFLHTLQGLNNLLPKEKPITMEVENWHVVMSISSQVKMGYLSLACNASANFEDHRHGGVLVIQTSFENVGTSFTGLHDCLGLLLLLLVVVELKVKWKDEVITL